MLRFAIMGPGRIAPSFVKATAATSSAEVVAVASKSTERAKNFAKENNIHHYYGNYAEMLDDKNIDAVYISTTHNYHYDNIKQCLLADKHVLCEKSMCVCASDANELFTLAKDRGLLLAEGMWIRFLPIFRKAAEIIKSDTLGDIFLCDVVAGFHAQVPNEHRLINPKLGGGVALDISVYAIEAVTFLFGNSFTNVSGNAVFSENGADLINRIFFNYGNTEVRILTTLAASPENYLLIAGTNGSLLIPRFIGGSELIILRDGCDDEKLNFPYENGFSYEIDDFAKCVSEGKTESAVIPAVDTIACAEILDCILERSASHD